MPIILPECSGQFLLAPLLELVVYSAGMKTHKRCDPIGMKSMTESTLS